MAFVPFTKDEQPTMAAFNKKFEQAIGQALADGVKIEVGSYVGTGTYGSSSQNSLTFGFEPKMVILSSPYNADYVTVVYMGQTSANTVSTDATFSWSGNAVSWYSKNADDQLNVSGRYYNYIAIG